MRSSSGVANLALIAVVLAAGAPSCLLAVIKSSIIHRESI